MREEQFASDEQGATSESQELELVAPLLPRKVLIELCAGRCFEDYRRKKLERLRRARIRGLWIQRQMGLENAERETRFVDGLGQHIATIDPLVYHAAELRYGEGCWRDKEWRNHTLKRSPELRVPAPKPRFIPVNGFRCSGPDERTSDGPGMVRRENLRHAPMQSVAQHETPGPTISTQEEGEQ
jgi:hypothetical protein